MAVVSLKMMIKKGLRKICGLGKSGALENLWHRKIWAYENLGLRKTWGTGKSGAQKNLWYRKIWGSGKSLAQENLGLWKIIRA